MDLYTEINALFFSIATKDMPHSEKMEKLRILIINSSKESFDYGVKQGVIKAKNEIEKLLTTH